MRRAVWVGFLELRVAPNVIEFALATPVVAWAGAPFFVRGWQSVRTGYLNMFTLIALGIGVAFLYSALATLYMAFLGVTGEWVGPLLWPAMLVHALLTFLLARAWFKPQENGSA